jgi:hypothetical protein
LPQFGNRRIRSATRCVCWRSSVIPVCSGHASRQVGSHKSDSTPNAHLLRVRSSLTIVRVYTRTDGDDKIGPAVA